LHGSADFRLSQSRSRFDFSEKSLVLIFEECYDAGHGSFHAQVLQSLHELHVLFSNPDSNFFDDASSYALTNIILYK
jgi:hypothetical protein